MSSIPVEPKKYSVRVEYCVPCDYSQQALAAAVELTRAYQHVIDRLELVMGSKGIFTVTVDGTVAFSKADAGRFPEEGELLKLFEHAVGTRLEKYPHD